MNLLKCIKNNAAPQLGGSHGGTQALAVFAFLHREES